MSAELLRQAADRLEQDHAARRVTSDERWLAVAAWLRAAAEDRELDPYLPKVWDAPSVAAAHAILGRSA